ncbi:amino acid ABC transporter ATP-binding protein [Rhizobiaceae bacterium BDR2-2]|uniref:Amino acid ABC transporter ATP-binding protein n=1 Tax=Ectorhizobium quercum TaxID=2965071 RepID=A0AAE3MYF5_9HYPH|nr:amino acid ABC transporter ATP-binding protein [Ectorhizobium quercum]MCX8997333.1 amino acid ABC transporter ATP-binding protein [Ectorhizobium quercum]
MSPVVEMKNVQKNFGALQVLKGIDLTVDAGEVVAIIGQSGSGKSTALRCLDRLETIEGGELRVCGHALHDRKVDLARLRQDVGIVFQSYNLFPHMTAAENVMLALRLVKKKPFAEARTVAEAVLTRVGLADRMDMYPEQLSGGQQQRVAIARGLALAPKLMLFDEVTSALDPQLTTEVLKVIEQVARDGMTMVLVTHEMDFARKVANRVVYMHKGRVNVDGPASVLDAPPTAELADFLKSA